MPRFEMYSVDYDNSQLHMKLKGTDTLDDAWTWAVLTAGYNPSSCAMRVYEGKLAALEVRPGIAQFGLWHHDLGGQDDD